MSGTRADLDRAFLPPEPIQWPGGETVQVKAINFRQQ